jgi:hypothetical protein
LLPRNKTLILWNKNMSSEEPKSQIIWNEQNHHKTWLNKYLEEK